MKEIYKRFFYSRNSARYNLDDVYSEEATNKGLIICYLLTTHKEIQLVSLELEAEHEEIGVPLRWYKRYSQSTFSSAFASLKSFLNMYDDDDFGKWKLTFLYQHTEVRVSGKRESTEIGCSYPEEAKANLLPLLGSIETESYQYNSIDKILFDSMKNQFGMTDKRAVLAIKKLQSHMDIFEEFVRVFTSGKYESASDAISVEGFTAEQLNKSYPLSILGAYNYLIYLRELPKEALADLAKGLPRK